MLSQKPPSYEHFYRDNLALVEQVAAYVCRRYYCQTDEAEDFRQSVHVELIKDDYARLRAWEGRSSLRTFLVGVVRHLFQDYLIRLRGKRRTSEVAKRLGPLAEKLEHLLRDFSFSEACEILLTNFKAETTWEELWELACKLPSRPGRHMESEEVLENVPSPGPLPDESLRARERIVLWRRIDAALGRARDQLSAEDQLLLRMNFEDGFRISTIARTLCQDQKRLYVQRTRILALLRRELERDGIAWKDVAEALSGADKGGLESV